MSHLSSGTDLPEQKKHESALHQLLKEPSANGAGSGDIFDSNPKCTLSQSMSLDIPGDTSMSVWPCCQDNNHRRLAYFSVICGLSCIGATALIYSVKAEEKRERDPEKAQAYSNKARCRAILSIVVGLIIPFAIFALVVFGSYLLTLVD